MATEEVGRPPSLPQYPQMIVEAIAALKQKEGANKSAISKYIESKYGEVPPGHSNLLSAHLTRMKDSGELVFFKNNYLLPDPSAPPRRGRGRPPKPKDPSAEKAAAPGDAPPTSPRGRGRPRKDPNAEPAPKKPKPADKPAPAVSKTGRPRGRPRKVIPAPAVGAANGV
ncbi:OLC1v1011586C1 [Oldenlandia corymbosa var. corymbosa]|uniref:HMG-Y-related protein A n=1 Tax=Oldenlandia corymbosa var. corymbosa TaxID=529605 RepID=A0AAV1DXE6_OLDCO|nr:OLC1v1011586C1 [Oldenlandia corymbosa var. corymbosa]